MKVYPLCYLETGAGNSRLLVFGLGLRVGGGKAGQACAGFQDIGDLGF